MKIVDSSIKFDSFERVEILKKIERAGRICYKIESEITEESASAFVKKIISLGHEAVIEHVHLTAHVVCDRGVSHELVRHRLASYCQESTRYCNYSQEKFGSEVSFIMPQFSEGNMEAVAEWGAVCGFLEEKYLKMLSIRVSPQIARSILPNSLKTEVIMTANLREWRHVLKLRTSKRAHPDMRILMLKAHKFLVESLPEVFADIEVEP